MIFDSYYIVGQSQSDVMICVADRNNRYKIITNNNCRPEAVLALLLTCIRHSVEMDLCRGLQGHRVTGVADEAGLTRVADEPG